MPILTAVTLGDVVIVRDQYLLCYTAVTLINVTAAGDKLNTGMCL